MAPATITVTKGQVVKLLRDLLSRKVSLEIVPSIEPHPATYRGLVNDDNRVVAAIACDLGFAHRSGAALAMIPSGVVDGDVDDPDEDFIDFYHEVTNVLSRLVNEAYPTRIRIDPGLAVPAEQIQHVIDNGRPVLLATVTIDGYGDGNLGIWYNPQ